MIGRRVSVDGKNGVIKQWEPLSAAMTDALIEFDDGKLCWYASYCLRPIDGAGPLPSRREAQARANREQLASLESIRQKLVDEFHKAWPGAEFAKAIVGKSIDGAIADVKARLK